MASEIAEQPAVLEKTLREEAPRFDSLRRKLAERKPAMVVLIARGTSDNAAGFGRYLIEITTGIPVSLAAPSVTTVYGGALDWSRALVGGISQSGESTDTNACLEAGRKSGALTVGITNEPESAATISSKRVLVSTPCSQGSPSLPMAVQPAGCTRHSVKITRRL